MYHDGNSLDMHADEFLTPEIDLRKAATYVIAAAEGRTALLGLIHEDTQKSLELLRRLLIKVQVCRGVEEVERQRVVESLVGCVRATGEQRQQISHAREERKHNL